jgi:D-alanine-D-alanine ligase
MTEQIRVGVVFGGKSAEHEVSLQSARNVIDAIDRAKYAVVPIAIDKQGHWHIAQAEGYLKHADDPARVALADTAEPAALVPGRENSQLVGLNGNDVARHLDVVFPVLHGPLGEDGTVQGLLKLADIPFVGAGVLGSAVGMDKDVMKRLLRDAGLPLGEFVTLHQHQRRTIDRDAVIAEVGYPCFVKPANMGSSVGISKVHDATEWDAAIDEAFRFDTKILVEEFIEGREIEVAVLGNENPEASVPGEIVPHQEFYSYDAKYIDPDGAGLVIPADLSPEQTAEVQRVAVATFEALCCAGMGRVDSFVTADGRVLVNEINTIPGFTRISMYPKLWAATGLDYPSLIDRLITLALERHTAEKELDSSYS